MAWTSYIGFALLMATFRWVVRTSNGYIGNLLEDVFAALFLYPSVGQQLKRCYEKVKGNRDNNLRYATQEPKSRRGPVDMEPPGLV